MLKSGAPQTSWLGAFWHPVILLRVKASLRSKRFRGASVWSIFRFLNFRAAEKRKVLERAEKPTETLATQAK